MASVACVIRKAQSVGVLRSVYEIYIRDTVDPSIVKKVGEYIDYKNVRDALTAGQGTEFGDAANTLAGITAVTGFNALTDL